MRDEKQIYSYELIKANKSCKMHIFVYLNTKVQKMQVPMLFATLILHCENNFGELTI